MGDGYEQAMTVEDPLLKVKPEARALIEDVIRLLRERKAEEQSDVKFALLSLLSDSGPNPALDHAIPSKPFQKKMTPLLKFTTALMARVPSAKGARGPLLQLQVRQLEAYVAMSLKSKEEREAETSKGKLRPGTVKHYRFEKTTFDEPKAWLSLGSAGFQPKQPDPTSASSSSAGSSLGSTTSSDMELTSVSVEKESHRTVLSHEALKDLRKTAKEEKRASRASKKEKRKQKKIVKKTGKAGSGERVSSPRGVLPPPVGEEPELEDSPKSSYGRKNLENLTAVAVAKTAVSVPQERAMSFAHPTATRENCYKGVEDPDDLIPLDAFGKVLPSEAGVLVPTFVALWYKNGNAVFGRLWQGPEGLCASFAMAGREYAGLLGSSRVPGTVEILCFPTTPVPAKAMRFTYAWLSIRSLKVSPNPPSPRLPQWVQAESDKWKMVRVMGAVPCLVGAEGAQKMGAYLPTSDSIVVGWKGVVEVSTGAALNSALALARRED